MSEKLCVFCVHLRYNESGYGDYADPASLECMKGRKIHGPDRQWMWPEKSEKFVYDIDDFRAVILHAKDCPDYTEAKHDADSAG